METVVVQNEWRVRRLGVPHRKQFTGQGVGRGRTDLLERAVPHDEPQRVDVAFVCAPDHKIAAADQPQQPREIRPTQPFGTQPEAAERARHRGRERSDRAQIAHVGFREADLHVVERGARLHRGKQGGHHLQQRTDRGRRSGVGDLGDTYIHCASSTQPRAAGCAFRAPRRAIGDSRRSRSRLGHSDRGRSRYFVSTRRCRTYRQMPACRQL